jgi:hypothetical protein
MSIVNAFFQHQLTMKMYHFQTKSYGAHKAADAYLVKYDVNFDRFMEAWQGANGRLNNTEIVLKFNTVTDNNVSVHLDDMINFLTHLGNGNLSSDLTTIRDDMVADLRQLKYLLTFQ